MELLGGRLLARGEGFVMSEEEADFPGVSGGQATRSSPRSAKCLRFHRCGGRPRQREAVHALLGD